LRPERALTSIGPQHVHPSNQPLDLLGRGLVPLLIPSDDLDQVDLGLRRFGYFQQGGRAGGITHTGDDDVGRVGRVKLDEFKTDPTGSSGD
jgi:hypothetical protein